MRVLRTLRVGVGIPFWALSAVLLILGVGMDVLGHVIAGTWDWQARHPNQDW